MLTGKDDIIHQLGGSSGMSIDIEDNNTLQNGQEEIEVGNSNELIHQGRIGGTRNGGTNHEMESNLYIYIYIAISI